MLEYDILDIRGNLTSVGQQQKKTTKFADITQRRPWTSYREVGARPGLCRWWEQIPDYANEMGTISEFRLHFRISSKFQNFANFVTSVQDCKIFQNCQHFQKSVGVIDRHGPDQAKGGSKARTKKLWLTFCWNVPGPHMWTSRDLLCGSPYMFF